MVQLEIDEALVAMSGTLWQNVPSCHICDRCNSLLDNFLGGVDGHGKRNTAVFLLLGIPAG